MLFVVVVLGKKFPVSSKDFKKSVESPPNAELPTIKYSFALIPAVSFLFSLSALLTPMTWAVASKPPTT